MAGSVNKVILVGNLGRDPEIRSFQNGGKVANLRIATSENWKDRTTGERKERTEWHTVAIFNEGLVGVVERYLKKGSKVYVEGQLETRKWQDQSGQDRYSTEIVLRGIGGTLTMPADRRRRAAAAAARAADAPITTTRSRSDPIRANHRKGVAMGSPFFVAGARRDLAGAHPALAASCAAGGPGFANDPALAMRPRWRFLG